MLYTKGTRYNTQHHTIGMIKAFIVIQCYTELACASTSTAALDVLQLAAVSNLIAS